MLQHWHQINLSRISQQNLMNGSAKVVLMPVLKQILLYKNFLECALFYLTMLMNIDGMQQKIRWLRSKASLLFTQYLRTPWPGHLSISVLQARIKKQFSTRQMECWLNNLIISGFYTLHVLYISYFVIYKFTNLNRDNNEKEFTTMCCSPSGQALCVGSYDR